MNNMNEAALVDELSEIRSALISEIGKIIVGQEQVIELLLISLFSKGHSLFIGVPGLAKTLLVSTLAEVLDLKFNRVQFTPDLMPADVVGTDILEEGDNGRRTFRFFEGPVFSNLLLADEINRTPPKTQSALLQAMQELKVTSGGKTYPLNPPFMVMATQNPIEQEGTYPLPEAQLDRFLFSIRVDYPSRVEEQKIVDRVTGGEFVKRKQIVNRDKIIEIQELVSRVPVAPSLLEMAVRLVRSSRPQSGEAPSDVNEYVRWGAGPRASIYIILAAKARALLHGRPNVSLEDLRVVSMPVLSHRIIPNHRAHSAGISADGIAEKLVDGVFSRP